jgi:uncharacterized membrane protein (Fun14 family)
MDGLDELLSGPIAALGFGGVAGAIVGYTAKKVTKLVAIILGVVFIVVQLLVYLGYVTVNWEAVESGARSLWASPDGLTLADRAWAILRTQLPFGGGFVAGFALGFKLG